MQGTSRFISSVGRLEPSSSPQGLGNSKTLCRSLSTIPQEWVELSTIASRPSPRPQPPYSRGRGIARSYHTHLSDINSSEIFNITSGQHPGSTCSKISLHSAPFLRSTGLSVGNPVLSRPSSPRQTYGSAAPLHGFACPSRS